MAPSFYNPQSVPVEYQHTYLILHDFHVGPALRVYCEKQVIFCGVLSHSHHSLNLVADFEKVGVDFVGYRQSVVAVKEILSVALGLGGSLAFEGILNLAVVDYVDEVGHKLLRLGCEVAEFVKA